MSKSGYGLEGKQAVSGNHRNRWRTAAVTSALKDRHRAPGEPEVIRETGRAFLRVVPILSSEGGVGINQRKASQVRKLLCKVTGKGMLLKEHKEGPGLDGRPRGPQGCQ